MDYTKKKYRLIDRNIVQSFTNFKEQQNNKNMNAYDTLLDLRDYVEYVMLDIIEINRHKRICLFVLMLNFSILFAIKYYAGMLFFI